MHSQAPRGGRLRNGVLLRALNIAALRETGFEGTTIARPGSGEMGEDAAAAILAAALVRDPKAAGLWVTKAGAGRVNIYATIPTSSV